VNTQNKLDTSKATVGPWRIRVGRGEEPLYLIECEAGVIATIDGLFRSEQKEANAELIVRAVCATRSKPPSSWPRINRAIWGKT